MFHLWLQPAVLPGQPVGFDAAEHATLELRPGRLGYVHLVTGRLQVNGHLLGAGDALKFEGEPVVELVQGEQAEVLVFDLPAVA